MAMCGVATVAAMACQRIGVAACVRIQRGVGCYQHFLSNVGNMSPHQPSMTARNVSTLLAAIQRNAMASLVAPAANAIRLARVAAISSSEEQLRRDEPTQCLSSVNVVT